MTTGQYVFTLSLHTVCCLIAHASLGVVVGRKNIIRRHASGEICLFNCSCGKPRKQGIAPYRVIAGVASCIAPRVRIFAPCLT